MYLVYVSAAGEPVKMPPEIEGVVAKYPDLFEEPTGVVEREVVHAIEIIPGSSIPKGRIYRMSLGELDELRRQLKELVEKGWIRPSVSPYGSPVLFVPKKKEGTLRMCIDYRGLNAIAVKNREPLTRIDDLLDRVQGCWYFSKIDLKSRYHQIAIRPEDQHKTAFQTRYDLYGFVVMPFGLCNAPGTFQHAMNRIFHDYLDKFVIVYLDDILIFSKTVEEHVAHLDKVLDLLRQHKFKINGEKCEFGRTRVLYLGHEISAEGLKPDDAKVASIRDWPRPQSVTEMRSFLGMTGYYRTFVKNYSIVAAPLTDLTRLDTPWKWTDECEAAFRHLKHALTHYEVLKLPDPDKLFIVTTDASQYGIGAVLAQQEGPKLRLVEYMSKKMSSQKLAKSTYEKELYVVYKALTHWRHYLLGRFFILRTDHQTLRWMRTQPVLSDALKRWIEVIEQYDFDPQYLKGEYNKVADALSRRPDFSGALITEFDLTDDVTQSLVEAYREDQFMSEIIRRLEAKDKKTSAEFELINGLLFLEKEGNKRLCDKPRTQAPLGLLKPLPIPERPGESLSMDFMDTLVTSKSGMRQNFVIVDRFSKFARLVAMPETAKTEYVIKLFKENWVRDFGLPKSIVSDRDVRFTSELWKAAAAEQGTQLQTTSGNHPEANGQAEQMNRVVQHLLRHFIKPNQVDWDEKLALVVSLYNNAVHSATGVAEAKSSYGAQVRARTLQDGKKLRPIEYTSKKMPSKKLAKSTYERELYALYKALVHWRHFLLGRFFYLRTDHQTLKWIKTQPALSDALKRWIEVIYQYDFQLEYLKGEYNKVANALSRRADYLGALVSEFGVSEELTQSLVGAYQENPVTINIIRKLQAKDKATEDEFVMVDGLLFLDKAEFKRLVVPSSERLHSLFLGECHDATGHFGYKKTSANLVQRFWWPGMIEDAKKYVETCQVCQRDKPRTQAPLGLLKPLPIPAGPGQSVSMDFMDTLVTSRSGKRHIFVIIDRFTKYARLIAMPETARTEHVIKLFMDNWVRDFGLPKSIVSDRDVRFTSELWKKTAEQMGSQLQMTSGNHPEANEQAEQMNTVVQHLLRHYIKPILDDWDEKLPLIASLYNNAVHSSTDVSPNQLHLGWKPRSAMDFLLPENRPSATPGTLEYGVQYEKLLQKLSSTSGKLSKQ
ncbi:hypothetical protein CBR_g8400 [Chara braunii]|uniref:Reverse transcriptase n=1 Tax=Chara braunii TaxID=69332 RepID=A0A388KM29_CHABU|nr:hypothetical protein CBR_g8400 [Chara braunii]|eukprot:GBG71101.1 hypothetical protein CBR_g8400 [Chara braunii]